MASAAYQIEKGVPLPAGQYSKYPLTQMEVGDSFVAENRASIRRAISAHAKRHNRTFTCRVIGDGQMRVWRVA